MTPNSIGFICHTYVTIRCDIVTVECIESKKSEGQTNIQTYKRTNKQTREPLGKGESRPGSDAGGQDILPCNRSIVAVNFIIILLIIYF